MASLEKANKIFSKINSKDLSVDDIYNLKLIIYKQLENKATEKDILSHMKKYLDENKTTPEIIFNQESMLGHREKVKYYIELETRKIEIEEGIVKCPNCKSTHTTYTRKQVRRADESATAFGSCFDCGKRFVIG